MPPSEGQPTEAPSAEDPGQPSPEGEGQPSESPSSEGQSADGQSTQTFEPNTPQPAAPPPPPKGFRVYGAAELAAEPHLLSLRDGQFDVFGLVTPILALEVGTVFSIELSADLRLRAFGSRPELRDTDYWRVLRRLDWDQLNDFAQPLQRLRIGSKEGPFHLQAGALRGYTLGHGHLISRYDNRLNPDYHPAGAALAFSVGPLRSELFASDVIGGRIFAGDMRLDIGRIFSLNSEQFDRYHMSISTAHDAGRAGGASPTVTLLHMDADAALYIGPTAKVYAVAGFGGRMLEEGAPNLGAVVGFTGEGIPAEKVQMGGRLELRKQGGLFRHGLLGPTYELSRFSGLGFTKTPVASEALPDSFSGYAEIEIGLGPTDPTAYRERRIVISASGEYYLWGRLDLDARVTARLPGGLGAVGARFALVGFMQGPQRYDGAIEVRYRVAPSIYAIGEGGTVFFPQAGGTLLRGVFGGLGVGFDFEG